MAKLAARVKFKVTDKDGNLILASEQPSRSFVLHFFEFLYMYFTQTNRSIDDITGTSRGLIYSATSQAKYSKQNLSLIAPPGPTVPHVLVGSSGAPYYAGPRASDIFGKDYGIVVGNGAGAVTPQDDALAQKLAHGRGTNQFEHGGSEVLEPAFSDPNAEMLLRRYFTNRSGATITVTECGIYAIGTAFHGGSYSVWLTGYAWPFCIARDLVTPNIDVLTTEILEVSYLIQTTV